VISVLSTGARAPVFLCSATNVGLFALACELDLEGIAAKRRSGLHLSDCEETSWLKICNRAYSQMMGRK
jgi:ATP-dependent DNA ligase